MGVKIDLRYWSKKYEDDYPRETVGNYPIFVDEKGVKHEEKSPYFETMSRVLQQRGYLLKLEFVSIGKWKTRRQTPRYEKNEAEGVKNATMKAMKASQNKKLQILRKLNGVEVPVASAILTVIYPEKYCVIDYRTWRALHWLRILATKGQFTLDSYREYADFLDTCKRYGKIASYHGFLNTLRAIGAERDMTPRQVEMALWKFDQKKGEK